MESITDNSRGDEQDLSARKCADILLRESGFRPNWLLELGSGLYPVAEAVSSPGSVGYTEFPDFPIPTTLGHPGVVCFSEGDNGGAFLFCGRSHLYEGVPPADIAIVVRIAATLGVDGVLFCSTCGSVADYINLGALLLSDDIIHFPPYIPKKFSIANVKPDPFPVVAKWIDEGFSGIIKAAATRSGIPLQRGTIGIVPGPCYETKAEVEALRRLGVAAVTMSCGPSLRFAHRLGVPTALLGGVTNRAGDAVRGRKLSHEAVIEEAAGSIVPKMIRLLRELIGL